MAPSSLDYSMLGASNNVTRMPRAWLSFDTKMLVLSPWDAAQPHAGSRQNDTGISLRELQGGTATAIEIDICAGEK